MKIINENNHRIMGIIEMNHQKCMIKHLKSKDETQMHMLLNEVDIYTQLKHVDFVPKIYEYNINEQSAYIIYEYIDGVNLNHFLFHNLKEKVIYMIKILECVGKLHDNGIIHCDLKPSNIMITKEGTIKIVDFGISSKLTETRFKGFGSIVYASKEQLEKETLNFQTDLYSIGILFYQLTNRNLPFVGSKIEINEKKRLGVFEKSTNPLFNLIYTKALNNDLNKRYQNTEEFINDLKLFIQGG